MIDRETARYLLRRLLWAVLAALLVLTLAFGLLATSPNPETSEAAWQAAQSGGDAEQAQQTAELRRGEFGSLGERYVGYVVSMVTFQWGESLTYDVPVTTVIADAWTYSAMIVVPAAVVAVAVGFAVGVYAATHQYSRTDYAATLAAFVGVSVPNFWLAVVLLLVFGELLGLTPISYDSEVPFWSLEHLAHLVLPIVVLTTATIASQLRYARAETLEYVGATWVTAARAKGLDERTITRRHVFRPALVPLVTILIADLVGVVFATAYVVEVIFGIPGLGYVSYQALLRQDTPLVLATTVLPAFLTIVANLCQDLAYTALDPRIDLEGGSR